MKPLKPYKNILLAYDDSKYSSAALIEILNWAKVHGGKVTIVHAVFFDSEEFSISPDQLEKRLQKGREMCEDAVGNCSSEFGLEVQYLVVQGEPHAVIPEIAREISADLIVMGTYGRRGFKRMIMGSVTSGVILNSPCDVLVVKKPCEDCTGEYRRILVPYDESELSRSAVQRVEHISNSGGPPSVTILYVIPRYEEMVDFFKTGSIERRLHEEATRVVMAGEKIAAAQGITANTVVEEGVAADMIVETAKGLGSDLIIMGSHGWHGIDKSILGSTTERVIARSSIPVLVVRN